MDHFPSLEPFRYGNTALRPLQWLGFNHEQSTPCHFLEYPTCHGWTPTEITNLKSKTVDETFRSDVLPMLQSWLFLGALESLTMSRIRSADFIRTRLGKPVISTQFLADHLETWRRLVRNLSDDDREVRSEEVRTMLAEMQFWCFKLASSSTAPDVVSPWPPVTAVDSVCRLITLVGESINTARTHLHTPEFHGAKGFVGVYTKEEERRLTTRLVKVGWCPFMAGMLITYRYSVAEYASFWSKKTTKSGRHHDSCSSTSCVAYNVDTGKYQQRHELDGCECAHLAPTVQKVVNLLAAGKIPVIGRQSAEPLSGSEKLCVVEASETTNVGGYAAISHVWSDGIGSTTEVGLPRCTIDALFERASAYGRKYIWLDSLCVPQERTPRDQAIRLMAQTYQDAAITIVLDSQLRCVDFSLEPRDIELVLLHLVTSPWMQRLWTLQEAVLSRSLIFQFRNTLASALDLSIALVKVGQDHLNPVTQVLGNEFRKLLKLSHPDPDEDERALELGHVYRMLRSRSTSKDRDETVAVAGLFGVDVRPLLAFKMPEERMRCFLTLLRRLPSDIIFTPRARMRGYRGFSWAPQSFLMKHVASDDRTSLTTGSRRQWAECQTAEEGGGLRGRYLTHRLSRLVSIDDSSAVFIRSGDELLQVMMAASGPGLSQDSFAFDCLAMLPHLGNTERMWLAAALASIDQRQAETPCFEYRGRLLVGDSKIYRSGAGPAMKEAAEICNPTQKEDVEIVIL